MKGILLQEERALMRIRQVPGRIKRRELYREVGLSIHKPQSLCSQKCLEKPELREPGGTGERGSVYKLLLWSQTARPRSNPSSTPSWLGDLGPSLLGFRLFIYTNLRWLGWAVSHIVKQSAQRKNWTYVTKHSITHGCITINITIKQADQSESGIALWWGNTQKHNSFTVHFIHKEHLKSSRKHACFHVLLGATILRIEIFDQYIHIPFFN